MAHAMKVKAIRVSMAKGKTFVVRRLLLKGDSNTKLLKSEKAGKGYMTVALSLAPAHSSGYQTCPFASPGCMAACIYTSGYAGIFANINESRIARTRAWFQHREQFKAMLLREMGNAVKRAEKAHKRLAVRLNTFSDIPWEKVFPEVFAQFPNVQFYDYTKDWRRAVAHAEGRFPANYHLTFSRSETNDAEVELVLRAGGNVTVVFDRKAIPLVWNGVRVVNGDETDLRFLDDTGVIVGLYAKGKGRKDQSGFVVNVERVPLNVL